MKYIIAFLLIGFVCNSFAQQMSYRDWKELEKNNINLRPEYGNVKKDNGYTDADNKYIKTVLESDGTLEKGSEHLVELGFTYLYRGDLQTAMKRFNQAWLLNPKNENAYWGFGAIYFTFNDYSTAIKQYDKGLILNPKSSNILTDKATIFTTLHQNNDPDNKYLKQAIKLFRQSYNIDPKNQNTLFKLSAAYFYIKDCTNASRYYNECMKLGGKSITPGYGDALKKICNN